MNEPIVTREMKKVSPAYEWMRHQRGYYHPHADTDSNGFSIGSTSPRFHLLKASPTPFREEAPKPAAVPANPDIECPSHAP